MSAFKLIENSFYVVVRDINNPQHDISLWLGSESADNALKARKSSTPVDELIELGSTATEDYLRYFLLNNKAVPEEIKTMWALKWVTP